MSDSPASTPSRGAIACRVCVTGVVIVVVETAVCGLAVMPVLAAWSVIDAPGLTSAVRLALYSVLVVPSYVAFALCLMIVSPLATWLTRARTPPNVELRLAEFGWPLMTWARYVVSIHLVRVLAGTLFRGSPLWTAYLRMNGARIGRRVYVNTLSISDHNLLEFGDNVVIGGDVHISGHVVEDGMLKTAPVRLARGVTIGLGSVVNIGVTVDADCQIGALSLVPKHSRLHYGGVYVGVPVRRLDPSGDDLAGEDRSPDRRVEL